MAVVVVKAPALAPCAAEVGAAAAVQQATVVSPVPVRAIEVVTTDA